MADLSAYVNFSIQLRYDLTTRKIRLTDTSNYPGGVKPNVSGIIDVLQPDGVSVLGSFSTPNVVYSGGNLTVGEVELRVGNDGLPQSGSYTITYTVRHPSYSDTALTRVFSFTYSDPTVAITKSFNVFTPVIKAVDTTVYDIANFSLQNVTRAWSAVVGTLGTVTGSAQECDLAYSGNYYDADYTISLTSTVQWTLVTYPWVDIFKKVQSTVTGSADTPATIASLRASLDSYKLQLDAITNDDFLYDSKVAYYTKASLLFQQMVERGRNSEFSGLEDYYYEIVRQLHDGVMPSYTNTNAIIPAYDWGVGSGSAAWGSITGKPSSVRIQWITGDVGFPAAGTSTFTDSRLSNVKIQYFRNGFLQYKGNPGDGDSYYDKPDSGAGSNILTVYGAFQTGDKNVIYTWPL